MGARPRKGAERGPGAAVMLSRGRAPTLGSMRTKVKGEQDSQAVLSLTATIFLASHPPCKIGSNKGIVVLVKLLVIALLVYLFDCGNALTW